jgi:hypothetical protein
VTGNVPPSKTIAMGYVGFSPDAVSAGATLHAETVITLEPAKFAVGNIGVGFLDPEVTGAFGSLHLVIRHNSAVLHDRTFGDAGAVAAFFNDQYYLLASGSGLAPSETIELLLDLTGYAAGSAFRVDYVVGAVPEPTTALLLVLGLALLARGRRVA